MRILQLHHSDRARRLSLAMGRAAFCLNLLVNQIPGADPTATVKIVALDTFGSFVPFRIVGFKDEAGRDLVTRFDKSVAVGIPFGEYWLHVQTEGLGPIRRKVLVSHTNSFIVVASTGFHIEYLPGKAPVLIGSIRSLKPIHGPTWVKLYAIYFDHAETVEVDPRGEFRLYNVTPGAYLISVMNESGLVMSRKVEVRNPGAKLLLDVKDSSIRTEADKLDSVP